MHVVSSCSIYCLCCNKIHILCGVTLMQHIARLNACPQQVTIDSPVSVGKSGSLKVFLCHCNKNLPSSYH